MELARKYRRVSLTPGVRGQAEPRCGEPNSWLLRHSYMVSPTLRVMAVLGSLFTVIVALVPQTASALSLPKAGVVEVTGYQGICCNGQSGPVVVTARGPKAAAVKTALADLMPNTSTQVSACMEDAIPFLVSLLPHKGAHPTLVATASSCGGQFVSIKVGQSVEAFKNDCALGRAVIAVLPRGRGVGTRQAVSQICRIHPRTQR